MNPVCSGPLPHVEASGFTISAPKSRWGRVVCPPPCGNPVTCVISLYSWLVFRVCPLSLTLS